MSDDLGKAAAKAAIGIGLTILNLACPPAGIAVTSAVVAAGVTAKLSGELEGNEAKKDLGEVLSEGGAVGGLTSSGVDKLWAAGGASAGSGPTLLGGGISAAYREIKEREEREKNK